MYYWSYSSLAIYVIVAFLGAYGIRLERDRRLKLKIGKSVSISAGYLLLFLAFWLLAVMRSTDNGLGGIDIGNYLRTFDGIDSVKISLSSMFSSEQNETLFMLIVKGIRLISDSHIFYLAVMYGIIVFGYIIFLNTYCPENISYIPLIMLVFPYIKSFCTLRSSVAVAFILIGLCVMRKQKVIGCIIILSSFFIHVSAILYIPFPIFYYLYKKRKDNMTTFKIIVMTIVYLVIVYVFSYSFKRYFGAEFITGNYSYYANTLNGSSFINRIPLYFMQLALAVVMIFSNRATNKIEVLKGGNKGEDNFSFIKICCIYDIIVIPAAFLFGIWRANEFFYLVRLLMWGRILKTYSVTKGTKILMNAVAFAVALFWLIFRLSHEYAELGIMPYVLR